MALCAKFVHGAIVRRVHRGKRDSIAFAHLHDPPANFFVRCNTRVCVRTRGVEAFSIGIHLALWITVCVNSAEEGGGCTSRKEKVRKRSMRSRGSTDAEIAGPQNHKVAGQREQAS
jgi:hypothetical protein